MTLPDPNAAVGVDSNDPTPAGWTASWVHVEGGNNFSYWYVDLPAPYSIRIMDISDHVHQHWFINTYNAHPRPAKPQRAHRPWSLRNIVLHQFAGGPGFDVLHARHIGSHGIYSRLELSADDKGRKMNSAGTRYAQSSYPYHFVIPYYADLISHQILVYKIQDLRVASVHASGHREMSLGVSVMGHPRTYSHPTGQYGTPEGRPAERQLKALRGVVRYLQDYYHIADSHVHGHFSHNVQSRRECPGYDVERYLLDLEDRLATAHPDDNAKATRTAASPRYCYPIRLPGQAGVPGLARVWERDAEGRDSVDNAKLNSETQRARQYMANARSRPGGVYPRGRRPIWHNGVHLHPAAAGEPVYAVRDGWLVAANLRKSISYQQPDGSNVDFGSASFILLQHSDPPVADARTWWNPRRGRRRPYPLNYYSLYMHLQPLAAAADADDFDWLKELRRRDSALHRTITTTDSTSTFGNLAIPVHTGEVIAKTGTHAPFAIAADGTALARALQPVLHFEMFSTDNLLEKFGFNNTVANNWTINDRTTNPLVESAHLHPPGNYGDPDLLARLNQRTTELDGDDPHQERSDLAPATEHADFQDAFSKIVVRHISEWASQWNRIPQSIWGGNGTGGWRNARDQWNTFRSEYVDEIQWLRNAWAVNARRTDLRESTNWLSSLAAWPAHHRFFYFHPIRMLNWLNGLSRGMQHPFAWYNGSGSRADTPSPLPANAKHWQITPRFDWEQSLA